MNFLKIILLAFLVMSCGNEQSKQADNNQNKEQTTITRNDITDLNYNEFILDSKAEQKIKDWENYFELSTQVTNVTQNDLSFFENNAENLKAFIDDLKASVPEQLNVSPITVRLTALETKMYKLEGTISLSNASKTELLYNIREFLVSFSNLNFQINKKFEKEAQNIQKPQ